MPRRSRRCGPLPLEPFRYYRFGERTVHLDGCVEVEAAYYGAPPGWIGRKVHVQWDDLHVRLLDPKTGQLLREHLRHPPRLPSHPGRGPPVAHAATAPRRCCAARHDRRHPHRHALPSRSTSSDGAARRAAHPRRPRLAKKHGPAAVEDAAQGRARARRARPTASSAATSNAGRRCPLTLRQVDPLIRQLTLYRDLIDRKTGDPT